MIIAQHRIVRHEIRVLDARVLRTQAALRVFGVFT